MPGMVSQNTELQKFIKKLNEKEKNLIVDTPTGNLFDDVPTYDNEFDGRLDEDSFYEEYSEVSLSKIFNKQMGIKLFYIEMIKLLKSVGRTKHLANRILLIFDDLVGSSLFSNARDNVFKGLNTRHRHYSMSMFMVAQGYKEIPKTVRINWTCLILFEIVNDRELDVIYEEYAMSLKRPQWNGIAGAHLEMFEYCTSGDHSFLFYNVQKPKRLRCMKNFQEILFFAPDSTPDTPPDSKKPNKQAK
jgi:hypothetical protein